MNVFDTSVTETHQDYDDNVDIWDQVDDCIKGEDAVKAKGTDYLPMPNPTDKSAENLLAYNAYKTRACFINFTGDTLDSRVGMVFSKPPKIELPPELEYLLKDTDGNGLDLTQHASGTVSNVSSKGRYGLLVDYPSTDRPVTLAEKRQNNIHPFIVSYTPQNIINWRTKKMGAVNKLCLVVLREQQENIAGLYKTEYLDMYRVLWLDDEGYYNQATMNVVTQNQKQTIENEQAYQPRDANGNRLTEIPFKFVGSMNNDQHIDPAPLYRISSVNLAHYRNSADVEDSSYSLRPTVVINTDMSTKEFEERNPCGVRIGSKGLILLDGEGDAKILETKENQLAVKLMQEKVEQIEKLGGKTTAVGNQTAEAARINKSSELAIQKSVVKNVNSAYADCIKWCSMFENGNDDPEFIFELNDNFMEATLTAQQLTALNNLLSTGTISQDVMLDNLREAGYIPDNMTNEDIKDAIEVMEPSI